MTFSGCGGNKEKVYKIGVSQCSGGDWREKMNDEIRREMLFHDDAVVEIRNADDDSEKQIADIRYFLDNNFDIIITAPNEADAITPVIREVYEKGVPVVIFDRRINGDYYTSYVDLDNRGIGRSAADYAASLSAGNPTDVLEITGLPGSTPAQERHQGFEKRMKDFPNLKIVESVAADWSEEKAYNMADSMLNKYPQIKIIYAHNDPMAVGASRLVKERGRDDIKILGTDASPRSGMPAVKEGLIDATFIYPTEGRRLIETAMSILHGDPYDKTVYVASLAPVDSTNADILMRQYDLLNEEEGKVKQLGLENIELWSRHKAQTAFLWTVIGFTILFAILSTLLIVLFIRNRKLGKMLSIRDLLASPARLEKIYGVKSHDPAPEKKQDILFLEGSAVPVADDKDDKEKSEINGNEVNNGVTDLKTNEFYNRFIALIKSRYHESDLNTDKIASSLSLGGAQLSRKIKAYAGYSPVEILRTYRLEQARRLLLSTDKTINEISHEVGFASPAYLTKCFRETYGVTPTEIREKSLT